MFPCVSIDIWKSARTKFFKFALYHELAGSSNPVIWSKSDMDIFLLQPKIPFYLLQSIPQFPHIRPTCVCHHYKSHDYPMGPSIKVVRKIWLIFDPPLPCVCKIWPSTGRIKTCISIGQTAIIKQDQSFKNNNFC